MPGSKLNSGRKMCKGTISHVVMVQRMNEQRHIMADILLESTSAFLCVS